MKSRILKSRTLQLVLLAVTCAAVLPSHAWRPSLYPENWTPPDDRSFTTDAFIQDFSYAGYRRGEEPVPVIAGPVFDVTEAPYNADPTGTSDSTAAIQSAIDDAAAADGGVVFLRAGTYLVEPQGSNNYALRIQDSNIVLRGAGVGETFVLNTSYQMRGKAVIRVNPSTSTGSVGDITADLDNPTRVIPVSNASDFQPGDMIRIEWEFSQGWIDEHNQNPWWSAPDNRPQPARYVREVVSVNDSEGWIEVDAPTRYTIRASRDNATVRRVTGQVFGVGIESFSIANVQHPGTDHANDGFGNGDYTQPGRAGYEVHGSWLLNIAHMVDSWVTDVHSYQPAENTSTAHMTSNGLALGNSYRVTVARCEMRRAQYGGGGGNGYMFRVQRSNECLIMDCTADFSRHGIVISHAGTSGNVFLRCEDRETRRATGLTGMYEPNSAGSDHHMHFSHSNLFDMCHAHNSFYTAAHRQNFGTIGHGLTSAHGVYWNTSGSGSRGNTIVISEQGRYGYVIGTSGNRSGATNPTNGNTAPADILEGIGMGETMEPQSLYFDQFARRDQGILVFIDEGASIPPTPAFPLNASTYSYGIGPVSHQWTQLSGPTVSIDDATSSATTVDLIENGTYVFELTVEDGDLSNSAMITITVDDTIVDPTITLASLESIDTILGRRQENAAALGYYVDGANNNNVGVLGSANDNTRRDLNIVYRYELPELPADHELSAFTFTFEITGLRDHSNDDYQLDVYLLDTDDATVTGDDFFYHGPNDTQHAFVDGYRFETGSNTNNIDIDPPLEISFTIDSGPALELLESFYEGNNPTQDVAAFRFNLDHLSAGLGGTNINRYLLNNDVAASAFKIQSLPAPGGNTFDDWIAGFDVGGQTGFSDDPDGDGIPNGLEAWFGTNPGEFSTGVVMEGFEGSDIILTHPLNPDPPVDIQGYYEWSPDLVNWYAEGEGPDGGPTVSFLAETVDDLTTVTAASSESLPRIFLRVRVERL